MNTTITYHTDTAQDTAFTDKLFEMARDFINLAGHYRGTDELEYGSFKTIANAVAHILIEVDNTDDFHAETF